MTKRQITIGLLTVFVSFLMSLHMQAQTCSPTAMFSHFKDGKPVEEWLTEYSGSAPVTGHFYANPEDYDGYTPYYEWWIYPSTSKKDNWKDHFSGQDYSELDYTFTESGTFIVALKVTFTNSTGSVDYPDVGEHTFSVTVAASKLEMPNAFSPNDDGYNDIYRAKPNYQSIVEFKATIFNRWGQKIYSWDDINDGWDGKINGRTVESGVFFVNVNAKGADGVEYKIRKDVNVLTRYTDNGKTKN